MANSIDFRADQVQTSKIIVTGSTPQKTLLIYGIDADGSPANQGNIDPAKFDTTVVGTDVFLFVSGTAGGRGGAIPNISVFGGDLHISGNLTVDGTSPGGGSSFFTEIAFEQIQTTGSVAMTYLSSSTGGEITGSFVNGSSGLVASGLYAHAEGDGTTASGAASHAEGQATVASGQVSHAEGFASTATGQYSHAEGSATLAAGEAAHSEGYATFASGSFSHAEGYGAEAFGTGSFAAGLYTVASGAVDGLSPSTTQAAFGKYNLRDNLDSLFVVGDGLDDSNRNDVLRVNSGSVQVTGSLIAPTITGSIRYVTGTVPFLINGANITVNYNSSGQWEITGSGGGGGGGTQKQFVAKYEETTSTTPVAIGQFSWIPSDYASLTTLRVRAIMSTDGTANHTGSLEIYNLTSGSYVNLIDTPSVSSVFQITSSTPTLVTSSNLLAGGTNFDNAVDSIYEVRISGSTANTMIVGGVELVYS